MTVAGQSTIPATTISREKRSMSLELFGQRLTVVSDNDEERVKDLVDFVNRKLEEVRDGSRRAQTDQIALLALLNVADELFREKQNSAALRRRVRERSVKLLGAIDSIAHQLELPAERVVGPSGAEGETGAAANTKGG